MPYLSTSADFIQRTYRFLREASASPTKWPSGQVLDYIDEAQAYVAGDFGLFQSRWCVDTAQASGLYAVSADILAVRYVLNKTSAGFSYVELQQGSLPDFWTAGRNLDASGDPLYWAYVGGDAGLTGFNIQVWPAPSRAVVSGLLVIGTETPESVSSAVSPLPRYLRPLVPLKAAILAWEDFGADSELTRYVPLYAERVRQWKTWNPDMAPDRTESRTFGEQGIQRPYPNVGGQGIVRSSPNPLNW